jgi:diaminopimelate decarboxylase
MYNPIITRGNQQLMEEVPLATIAEEFGTPCYAYSKRAISENFLSYQRALGKKNHLICYAVKSNSNIAVLQVLAKLGAGFDIVSIGELERVLMAGGDPAKVVYSGVAKSAADMRRALQVGIHCFNVESESELALLNRIAGEVNLQAPVSLRVNPDVDAKTHPYISTGLKESKFGIDIKQALGVYQQAAEMEHISVVGVDCHIGSQLTDISPFIEATEHLLGLVDQLNNCGIKLKHIDIGGGLGVCYQNEVVPSLETYIAALLPLIKNRSEVLIMEPGRSITANAGVLLTQVKVIKANGEKNFAIVDAAMNDMLRPALYNAWMNISPIEDLSDRVKINYDVVGPVCETGDFLGTHRALSIAEGDYLSLGSAGAYGFSMSSNYNSRPRASEVMVDGEQVHLIRARETIADLVRGEQLISGL